VDGTGGTEQPVPLNAAMANSMAAKLSDTELHAIFQMTERLKQKESLAARLAKEKEDLAAKLDGTEGVKQFLIAKVRDMEASLNGFVDNEIKVALQIASDQEVIAFLDGKVQELEREARTLQNEKQVALDTLERVQRQSNQKATVLGDMLQFEREKLSDQEREWKATKKLLVKEVKHCRAQIVALQAERDGYREQNETLRRAIMTNSSTANGSSNSANVAGGKQYVRDRMLA
jgi:chromosome segregation ATPase